MFLVGACRYLAASPPVPPGEGRAGDWEVHPAGPGAPGPQHDRQPGVSCGRGREHGRACWDAGSDLQQASPPSASGIWCPWEGWWVGWSRTWTQVGGVPGGPCAASQPRVRGILGLGGPQPGRLVPCPQPSHDGCGVPVERVPLPTTARAHFHDRSSDQGEWHRWASRGQNWEGGEG